MNLDSALVFNMISAFCLVIATVFTYKNYRLIKTIENENHFYKQKMESYPEIIKASYKLINDFQKYWEKSETEINFDYDKFKEDYIDSINLYRQTIVENMLFLPQDIINEVELFYENIIETTDEETTDEDIEKFIDECLDRVENIANVMRKDINLEPINNKLKARTLK